MPQLNLTKEELTIIEGAMHLAVTSAQRAQKSGKTPQITEAYKLQEATLTEVRAKILKAANGRE